MNQRMMIIYSLCVWMLFASPISAFGQPAAPTVLRVGTWGGEWQDALREVIDTWLEQRGVKVEYVTGNSVDNVAKIIAARGASPPMDLISIQSDTIAPMVKGGYLEKVNPEAIPNLAGTSKDVQHEYMVPYAFQEDGIAYRADKFRENGIPIPIRYSDLIHPKLANRVAIPELATAMAWSTLFGFSADTGGDEGTLERGLERMLLVKPLYYYRVSTELVQKMKMGEVWAAAWHVGWIIRLRRQGLNLDFTHAKVNGQTGIIHVQYIGIVKGTKAKAAAELYINRYLDPQVQVELFRRLAAIPTVKAAREYAGKDPELRDLVLWSDEQLRNVRFLNWDKIDVKKIRDLWNRTVTR